MLMFRDGVCKRTKMPKGSVSCLDAICSMFMIVVLFDSLCFIMSSPYHKWICLMVVRTIDNPFVIQQGNSVWVVFQAFFAPYQSMNDF